MAHRVVPKTVPSGSPIGPALLAVLALLLVGPAPQPAGATEQALTVSTTAPPKTLDGNDPGTHGLAVYAWMYDGLTRIDTRGKVQPALAESWRVEGPTSIVFQLRKGVRFHNGEEFDAESVKFTLEYNIDPKNKRTFGTRVASIKAVEILGKHAVRLTLKAPDAPLLGNLAVQYILPARTFREKGPQGFNRAPVGTGIFKVKSFKQDESITFEANRDFWDGAPKLARLLVKHIAEDATRVAALEAGEVDVIFNLPPAQARRLQAKGLLVKSAPIGQVMTINFFGANPKHTGEITFKPLQDVRVRQAIILATDRETIQRQIVGGYGRVMDCQLVGPDGFGYNPALKPVPFDPKRARDLLAQAGHPNGFSVPFDATHGRYPQDKEIAEAVVNYLAQVGIKAEMTILEPGVWTEKYFAGTMAPLFMSAWNYLPPMDLDYAISRWPSTSPTHFWHHPRLEDLFRKQRQALDAREREKLLQEINALICDEAPIMAMHQLAAVFGVQPKVEGLVYRADGGLDLGNVTIR